MATRARLNDLEDDRSLAPEVCWTLSVLRAAIHGREVSQADLAVRIEPKSLIAFSDRHALTPLMAWHLKGTGQLDECASPLAEEFTASFHGSMARALTQLDELARVLAELRERGIDAIPWKGPVLAHRLFGEAGVRECSDIDILMAPESLPGAELIVKRLGYLPVEYETEVRALLNEDHCMTYRHDTRPVAMELHARLFPHSFPFPLEFDQLELAEDSPHRIGDRSFPVFAADAELLVLSAHAAKHLWSRLAWIADIARLLERSPDLDGPALDRLARESRCHLAVQVSLLLAEDLLHAAIPRSVKDCFAPTAAARRLSRSLRRRLLDRDAPPEGAPAGPADWMAVQHLRIRSRESLRDRLRIIECALRYALAPNANDRRCVPGIRLPGVIAFACRPFRLLATYGSRVLRIPRKSDATQLS